jgi:hypothetical protein
MTRTDEGPPPAKHRASIDDVDEQSDTSVGRTKRKRGTDETETAAGVKSGETLDMSEASRPSKRLALDENRVTDEPHAPTLSISTPPAARSELLSRADIETAASEAPKIVAQPVHQDKVHETVLSKPSHNPLDLAPEGQPIQPKTWPMNTYTERALRQQMMFLHKDVEMAAFRILACIGDLDNAQCPAVLNPTDALAALYTRAFSTDWEAVSVAVYNYNSFCAPQATLSIISAFLYDNILSQQASVQKIARDLTELLQSNGKLGEAFLREMDLSQRGKPLIRKPFFPDD